MKRHAIILGNPAKTSNQKTSVTPQQLKQNFQDIEKTLKDLGDYSYSVDVISNKKRDESHDLVKKSIASFAKENVNGEHLIMFYYFGHGVERKNDLNFVFKNSDTSVPATLLPFKTVFDLVFDHNLKNAIFILDCCHAGAAYKQIINNLGGEKKYFVLASTIPLRYAHVKDGESPFGAFSLFFFRGLKDLYAAKDGTKTITINSLSKYTTNMLSNDGFEQLPFSIDGGLGELELSEATPKRIILPEFNKKAPRKSFYSKLYYIGNKIQDKKVISSDYLYKIIKKEEPHEFLTPVKKSGITVYEPIKEATFQNYLYYIKTLGIITDDKDLKFSSTGKRMFSNNGVEFNEILLELIDKELHEYELSLEKVDSLVRYKSTTRTIPTSRDIFSDARRRFSVVLKAEWFGLLLDLAANCGYFKFSSQKTYFAY